MDCIITGVPKETSYLVSLLRERNESEGRGNFALRNLVAIGRFAAADRALCVREVYKNGNSATAARRRLCSIRDFRNLNEAPNIELIRK